MCGIMRRNEFFFSSDTIDSKWDLLLLYTKGREDPRGSSGLNHHRSRRMYNFFSRAFGDQLLLRKKWNMFLYFQLPFLSKLWAAIISTRSVIKLNSQEPKRSQVLDINRNLSGSRNLHKVCFVIRLFGIIFWKKKNYITFLLWDRKGVEKHVDSASK